MPEILNEQNFIDAAVTLDCEVNVIKAVCQIEAPRGGFDAKGRPVILFEPYIFSDRTRGQFDGTTVTIKGIKYPLSINRRKKPWSVKNAKYGLYSIQHDKLAAAQLLDEEAALKACSWGKFQILGDNHRLCGHPSVLTFVAAMKESEYTQLEVFIQFIQNSKLVGTLQTKNWKSFAYHYNGPRQDKGTKDITDDYSYFLEKAYKKLCKLV